MTKNPLVNAIFASLYILVVTLLMNYASSFTRDKMNPIIGPLAFVSLFTLSAAVMGYLFLSKSLLLYLDGKKKQAVRLFIKTTLSFAGITILVFVSMFSGIFSH